jgi:hypothetical protein
VKVGREDIFKLTCGNQSFQETGNDIGVKVVNFATYRNLIDRNAIFIQCS